MCIPRVRTHFFMRKPCFVLFCFILHLYPSRILYLWCKYFVYFALVNVLDMLLSLCYCALLVAYSDDLLLCYMIILVIFIWLFLCLIKFLTCFISCLLDRNLRVTLYLSFYHLIYLEGLMCFMQVFQVTGIYVLSSSQLLNLSVSEFCHCSQTHV